MTENEQQHRARACQFEGGIICGVCGKLFPTDARMWEITVGTVSPGLEEGDDYFFEPSEYTDYRCPKCMGEKEQ